MLDSAPTSICTANLVDISIDLPVILQFVDTQDKLETWFPQTADVVKRTSVRPGNSRLPAFWHVDEAG